MLKNKNITKSILNEWKNFLNNDKLLKEEYDASTGKLILYHLTGLEKFKSYNDDYKIRQKSLQQQQTYIQPQQTPTNKTDRARYILNRLNNRPQKQMSDAELVASSLKRLIGYPFTSGTGFEPGGGAMYGPALYTCYEFNPKILHIYGDIAIKFETNIEGFLIFFEDVAKQIYGNNWKIQDQLRLLLQDKLDKYKLKKLISSVMELNIDSINNTRMFGKNITSDVAYRLSKIFFKHFTQGFIKQNIKGLIFRGNHDGPVCVIYNPQRDVNIVELGKVEHDEQSKETNIIWKDDLASFVDLYKKEDDDYISLDDITFERMNQLKQQEIDQELDYFSGIPVRSLIIQRANDLYDCYINNRSFIESKIGLVIDKIDLNKLISDLKHLIVKNSEINLDLLNERLLQILCDDPDINVKIAIATNRKCPEEVALKLFNNLFNNSCVELWWPATKDFIRSSGSLENFSNVFTEQLGCVNTLHFSILISILSDDKLPDNKSSDNLSTVSCLHLEFNKNASFIFLSGSLHKICNNLSFNKSIFNSISCIPYPIVITLFFTIKCFKPEINLLRSIVSITKPLLDSIKDLLFI